MKNSEKIIVLDNQGIEKEYTILFTFSSKKTNKDYVVYTDYSKGTDGNINVYSSLYHKGETRIQLQYIDTKDELDYIDKVLKTMEESLKHDKKD